MTVTIVGGMDLEKLHLTAEDILVVRGGYLLPSQLVALRDQVKKVYGLDILVLYLGDDTTLETLSRVEATRTLRAILGPEEQDFTDDRPGGEE